MMIRPIRHAILYLVPVGVSNVIPIIILPVLTRYLSREDYGVLALCQVYAAFMTGLANFGLLSIYERNYFECEEPTGAAELLYTVLIFVVGALAFLFGLTYLWREPITIFLTGEQSHVNLLCWSVAAMGMLSLKVFFVTYLKNGRKASGVVAIVVSESVLIAVASLVWVAVLNSGPIGIVWAQAFGSGVVLVAVLIFFLCRMPPRFNHKRLLDAMGLSYPLALSHIFKVAGSQADKYLLGLLGTMGGVGVFSLGQKLSNAVFAYMTALEHVFLPGVYARMFQEGEGGGRGIGVYLTPFFYASAFGALGVALFAEEAVSLLMPPEFAEAADVVMVLSLLVCTHFFGKLPQVIFARKTWFNSFMTVVRLLLMLGVGIPLIHAWGVWGAAWAACLAGLLGNGIYFALSQRCYRIEWEYKKLTVILLTLMGAVFSCLIFRLTETTYLVRLGIKVVWLVLYVLLIPLLGLVGGRGWAGVLDQSSSGVVKRDE